MSPAGCYRSSLTCCETCPKLKTGPQGCEYGDSASWCSTLRTHECYTSGHERICCRFCSDRHTSIPGCEYGDRIQTCRSSDCTDRNWWRDCCYTCRYEAGYSRNPTTTTATTTTALPPLTPSTRSDRSTTVISTATTETSPSCVDAATWCAGMSPSYCYTSASICCETCARHYRNSPGCEYGDQFTWCPTIQSSYCQQTSYQQDCCVRCQAYLTTTPPPTTTPAPVTMVTTVNVASTPHAECTDEASWCATMPLSSCYVSSDVCCQTCRDSYTATAGCEYGDHYTWCKDIDLSRCQEDDFKNGCCQTCRPGTTTTEGQGVSCQGDLFSFCSTLSSYDCYVYNVSCCATCSSLYYTGKTDCEYGDHNSWCSEVTDSLCVYPQYYRPCCNKCTAQTGSNTTTASTTAMATTSITSRTSAATSVSTTTTTVVTTTQGCVNGDTETWCSAIINTDCYFETYSDRCCTSCSQYKTTIPGCEFGDKASWCASLRSDWCYHESWQLPCCLQCTQLYTGVPGCEYGDKVEGCTDSMCDTLYNRDLCCGHCSRTTTTTTTTTTASTTPAATPTPTTTTAVITTTTTEATPRGCPAGDQASWCRDIPQRDCYVDDDVCCDTCVAYFTGIGGCEYGDRVSWCDKWATSQDHCRNRPDIMDNCCSTCRLRGARGTENPEEKQEGSLFETKESMAEVLQKEAELMKAVVKYVNKFCKQRKFQCCGAVGMDRVNTTVADIADFIGRKNAAVAEGFPQKQREEIVWTKILVRLQPQNLEGVCKSRRGGRRRHQRDAALVYMDRVLLHEILEENKHQIELEAGMTIAKIRMPDYVGYLENQRNLSLLIAITTSLLCCILLIVVIIVAKLKYNKYRKNRHIHPSRPDSAKSDEISVISKAQSDPKVFHNNLFRKSPKNNRWVTDTGKSSSSKSLPGLQQTPTGLLTSNVYDAHLAVYAAGAAAGDGGTTADRSSYLMPKSNQLRDSGSILPDDWLWKEATKNCNDDVNAVTTLSAVGV